MKKYRILPLLLIVCLLLTAAFPAAAVTSSDGVPQSTIQAEEGSYVLGSDAVKSALDEKLGANCVLLADEDSGEEISYQIVGDLEADIKQRLISVSSPFARALIGKNAGDSFEFKAPNGSRSYEILAVRYEG